jgi:hypothetical protein
VPADGPGASPNDHGVMVKRSRPMS